jgi:glutathione synthase/RimK-type ligase-like ATP-grasp enzyme
MVEKSPESVVFIATDAADVHADHVVNALRDRGVRALRFHPEDYPGQWQITLWPTSGGRDFLISGLYHKAYSRDVVAAWYRRPGPVGTPDGSAGTADFLRRQATAALRGLYNALEDRWLVSPTALRRAEDKAAQLELAAAVGLATPRTCLSNDPAQVRGFLSQVGGRVVVKPHQVRGVYQQHVFRFPLAALWDGSGDDAAIAAASSIYQEYIAKKLEVRAVVVGSQVFAAAVPAVDGRVDLRESDDPAEYRPHELPEAVKTRLVRLTSDLGSRFSAADLLLTPDGQYVFLDLNPNGQWLWLDLMAGLRITDALVDEFLATPGRVRARAAAR